MAHPLEKILQDALSDVDNLSPEKIETLLQEALKTLASLQEKVQSTDPKEREEALQMALALKEAMQAQTEEISQMAGIDVEEFSSFAKDPEGLNEDTLDEFKKFDAFQNLSER